MKELRLRSVLMGDTNNCWERGKMWGTRECSKWEGFLSDEKVRKACWSRRDATEGKASQSQSRPQIMRWHRLRIFSSFALFLLDMAVNRESWTTLDNLPLNHLLNPPLYKLSYVTLKYWEKIEPMSANGCTTLFWEKTLSVLSGRHGLKACMNERFAYILRAVLRLLH